MMRWLLVVAMAIGVLCGDTGAARAVSAAVGAAMARLKTRIQEHRAAVRCAQASMTAAAPPQRRGLAGSCYGSVRCR